MVYGNPSLLGTMVGDIQVYIDDTFRIYPSQFYQCLIIMVFDLQLSVYVPVFYVLTTGNTENLYWYALDQIYVASKRKLDPFSVTCAFEKALQNSVRGQFTNSLLNICLFYWKHAIRKKMIEFKIENEQMKLVMSESVLDILTVTPRDENLI